MGQYFLLTNLTRKESARIGTFDNDWEYYLKILGWNRDENIYAQGDYDDIYYLNRKAPENISELDDEGVWKMCIFAAKKLGITPEEFYGDFMNEDAIDVSEIKNINFFELERNQHIITQ